MSQVLPLGAPPAHGSPRGGGGFIVENTARQRGRGKTEGALLPLKSRARRADVSQSSSTSVSAPRCGSSCVATRRLWARCAVSTTTST
eukprot:567333-Prymnesium_polylepis.1